MKLSISVPDDLWTSVSAKTGGGPSDTVQRALRVLAEVQRGEERPLAHAPDQSDLDQYLPSFEKAVDEAVYSILAAQRNGYRFGLLAATHLTGQDLDALVEADAWREFRAVVCLPYVAQATLDQAVREEQSADETAAQGGPRDEIPFFSGYFGNWLADLLQPKERELRETPPETEIELHEIMGEPFQDVHGVQWDVERREATLSETYARSAFEALLDVRAEAIRRLAAAKTDEGRVR
jgi:hypothetical protein